MTYCFALAAFNLNLSPEEKRVFGQLFRQADSDNVGVVTGEVAVRFFDKTRLDSKTLGEVRYSIDFPRHVSWVAMSARLTATNGK